MDAYGEARGTRVHRTNAAALSRLVLSSKPCRHKAGRQTFTEAEQICLRKFTLRLYGVTHYTLRCKECAIRSLWTPLKAAAEQKQSTPIASASLQPYGSFRHKHTRSLSLICRIEVDNILTVGSNVSLRNGRVYPLLPPPRPPFSRRRLCICGGSYHISDDTAAVFSGGDFSLRLTLSQGQSRAILARSAERKQKRPVLSHTGYGEKHQKANGTCSLKKVISVPFMYVKVRV